GGHQCTDQIQGGKEVGSHDPDFLPCGRDDAEQQIVEPIELLVGAVKHQAGPDWRLRVVQVAVQESAEVAGPLAVIPVTTEGPFQLVHDTPFQAEVQVQHPVWIILSRGQVATADVRAPGEGIHAVHDHELAVRAHVDVERGGNQVNGVEAGELDAGFLQGPADAGNAHGLAQAVDDYLYLHPALLRAIHGIDELQAGLVVIENIGAEQYPRHGTVDRFQHRGEEDFPVLHRDDLVAGTEASANDFFTNSGQWTEV